MFSLIVVLISLVLVGVLATAVIYYGGSAMSSSQQKAEVAKLMNESGQILSAAVLYRQDSSAMPTQLSDLTASSKYLSSNPRDAWVLSGGFAVLKESLPVGDSVCIEYNRVRGVTGTPSCNDPAYFGTAICCTAAPMTP